MEYFIKKYYQNQLIKGFIICISIIIIAFFTLSFSEYLGRFETQTRTYLFYGLLGLSTLVLVQYIIRPILGLINIKRSFGYSEAAALIGSHFPEVQDKLVNTLQLQEKANNSNQQLLIASINQRIKNLSPIPFAKAIPYKDNIPYIKYALLPAILLVFILLTTPGFKKSSQRVVQYKTHFEIEAPFEFESDLEKDVAIQNEDIKIQLITKGEQIPQDAYLRIGTYKYKMKMDQLGSFSYQLRNVQKTEKIYFEAGGFSSREYLLNVAPKPSITNTYIRLIYPKYLNLKNSILENIGEINVPTGTIIEWNIQTQNVNRLIINPSKDTLTLVNDNAQIRERYLKSSSLSITTQNNLIKKGDSLNFSIQVSPDLYPSIEVNSQKDSLSHKILYFMGRISDDHGFDKLQFHYTHLRNGK